MNTIDTTERLFEIIRDMTPCDDGWEFWQRDDGKVQLMGNWYNCQTQPLQQLTDEFINRLERADDHFIEGNITCLLRSTMKTKSERQRLWDFVITITVSDISLSQIMTSAAALVWQRKKEKTPCQS